MRRRGSKQVVRVACPCIMWPVHLISLQHMSMQLMQWTHPCNHCPWIETSMQSIAAGCHQQAATSTQLDNIGTVWT